MVSAVLLAAGKGERLGGVAKAQLPGPDGRSLLESDVELLRGLTDEIVVGVDPEAPAEWLAEIPQVTLSKGGRTRLETLRNALEATSGEIVLVWDVARPHVPAAMVRALIDAAATHGAAMPVLRFRTRESLGIEKDGWLLASFPREGLFLSQTPQAYRRNILLDSLEKARSTGSTKISLHSLVDDAGYRVRLIDGSKDNRKVTFPEDLDRYLALLEGEEPTGPD